MAAVTVVDFETDAIEGRPNYPPKPVGVAILEPGRKPVYLAWGHPEGNNTTLAKAKRVLTDLWKTKELLFHNAKFDLDVAQAHLGLALPPWERFHDTMFSLFLSDPHAPNLSLKPSAKRLLGMEPEEQDAVADWVIAHGLTKGRKGAGAFISKVPASIVGPYAIGDVVRTKKLHDKLYPKLDREMKLAYDRERRLLPVLLANESEGIRVDLPKLQADIKAYTLAQASVDRWLAKQLGDINIDSDQSLAAALIERGHVAEEDFVPTDTGKPSVAKENLSVGMFKDPRVYVALQYRSRLGTAMRTFMGPWAEVAERNNGYIFTNWNQVRQSYHAGGGAGARTGRLSCSPNFQNIPKTWDDKGDGYSHPKVPKLPELPLIRRYCLPDKGQLFGHRDYNQQELRILAHFEDDLLLTAYREEPRMDVHDFVKASIAGITGTQLERRAVKVLNFGMLYGMGMGKLSKALGVSVEQARLLKGAQRSAIPGLRALEQGLRRKAKEDKPIRTWGGRLYYCEEPVVRNGREQTFEYKLLNYLIQGSAADCTKEAVIRYNEVRKDGRFLVTVHDEINVSAPKGAMAKELEVLREAMESVEFDVPMLSDAKQGPNWGDLKGVK
jgi:DNA polymerase-1